MDNFNKTTCFHIFITFLTCTILSFNSKAQSIISPLYITDKVNYDTDDPAIWINKQDPSQSLIIGTDKYADGALYVFDMNGRVLNEKVVTGLQRPTNVDIAYGFDLNGQSIDIAVTTERLTGKLRIYSLPDMMPVDGGGIDVFVGETKTGHNEPMGITLYKRPVDGQIYAIVGRKDGTSGEYLWQYLLEDDGQGNIKGSLVRKFGQFSNVKEIEGIAVDNELGYVYYSDETVGVRKYHADPAKGNTELALFATTGFVKDQEGIAIYKVEDGTGYILVSDQAGNQIHVYPREGSNTNPHSHPLLKEVTLSAQQIDGIEVANFQIMPDFPNAILVTMSDDKTFHLYRWEDIAGSDLTIQPPTGNPPTDLMRPSVLSINRHLPINSVTADSQVTFRATFSEPVTEVDTGDFELTITGGLSAALADMAQVSAAVYDLTVGNIAGSGTLRLDLRATGTAIQDTAGNAIDAGFSEGQQYTIEQNGSATAVLTRGPYLQMGSQSAITIRWRTDLPTDTKVEAGTTLGTYTHIVTSDTLTTEHELRLTNLEPSTKYYYRIGSISKALQGNSSNYFHTSSVASSTEKTSFAIFGDCGSINNNVQTNTLNAYLNYVGNNPAEVLLLLGDNAYNEGTDQEYQDNFFNPYGSTILKNHVLFPSPGNHDYYSTSQTSRSGAYYNSFSMPTNAESGGVPSGTEAYYSFDWGNVHFLSLDSYGEEVGNTRLYDTLGAQVSWVKADLAANTKPWVIAYWHHPPFTMGSHNSDTEDELIRIRENFIRILEREGVDLVLCGHSHTYERSYLIDNYYGFESSFNTSVHAKDSSSGSYDGIQGACPYTTTGGQANKGTVYVVSGSSGKVGGIQSQFPHNAMALSEAEGGMFYLEVEGNRLDGKFIREDGIIADQFTIMQDVNKSHNTVINLGETTELTASWIGDYTWTNGETTRSIIVQPNVNTTYQVTDGKNCLTDNFNIAVNNSSVSVDSIPFNSSWRYLDDGSDLGTAWVSPAFDDAAWSIGEGKLGYGIPDAATTVSYGPDPLNKHITTYFRKTFTVSDASIFSSFSAQLNRDDGVVVYINGAEVFRDNMPTGNILYNTLALDSSVSSNGAIPISFQIPDTAFITGDNIIAVEIHQHSSTSSDIAFDMELKGIIDETPPTDQTPPIVLSINRHLPADSVTEASQVTFRATFSEPVAGVDSGDFDLAMTGDLSATVAGMAQVSAAVYDLTVGQITGSGTLRLDLRATGTGIQDTAGNAINSGFSEGQQYTIELVASAPAVPQLTSPVHDAAGVSLTAALMWEAVEEADSYQAQVSTLADFATTVFDQSGISETTVNPSGLAANTEYFWRVRAENAAGTGDWSVSWSFITASEPTPPAAPLLASPADNASDVGTAATLAWNAVTDAESYQAQVSTTEDFATTVLNQSGITGTSANTNGLAYDTTYFWRTRATNPAGTSEWSAAWSFTTLSEPVSTGNLVAHWKMDEGSGGTLTDVSGYGNNAATVASPTWVSGVSGLALQLDGDKQYASAQDRASLDITGPITLATWIRAETRAHQYLIHKASNNSVDGYELSLTKAGLMLFRFNQATNGEALRVNSSTLYPADGATWVHVAATYDGTTARIYVNGVEDRVKTFSSPPMINENDLQLALGAQHNGFRTFKGAMDDARVYNRALTANEILTLANPSEEKPVTQAPAAPVLSSPSNNTTGVSLNTALRWNDAARAVTYQVQVSTLAEFATTIFNQSDITGTTVNPSGLAANTEYFWRVRAENAVGTGDWSPVWSFTTASEPTPPAAPLLASPADNASDVGTAATLAWNAVTNAESYQAQVSATEDFATTVLDQSGITGTSANTSGLAYNTTYFWRTRATNPAGTSEWSAAWSFTTVSEPVSTGNLVAHWKMDEGSGSTLTDVSGYGNNAATLASPTWVDGVSGLALQLDGGRQYASAQDHASLDITGPITLATWIKAETRAHQYLVHKAKNNNIDGYELSLTKAGLMLFRFNQATSGEALRVNSSTLYPADGATWMHVAATYDGTIARIYVNGVEDRTKTLDNAPSIDTNHLSLGIGAQHNGFRSFKGAMDDVRIYNKALTANEILALANYQSTASLSLMVNKNLQLIEDENNLKAYPNPFSSEFEISFTLLEAENYTVSLYNSKGDLVKVVEQGKSEPLKNNTIQFDGSNLPTGLYLIRLETIKAVKTFKIIKQD